MTTVRYWEDGRRHGLMVTGHAGYAEDGGPDIVCAGVSAICCALLGWAQEEAAEGRLEIHSFRQEAGDVHLVVEAGERWDEAVVGAFEVCLCGLRMIGERWPECVALS